MLYDEARYVYRGRFAESRFEKNCLSEYAEVFKTVGVDAAYYTSGADEQQSVINRLSIRQIQAGIGLKTILMRQRKRIVW
jgi:hypothetical protein